MTPKTAFDLIFRRAVTPAFAQPVDIGVSAGRIAAIAPRLDFEAREIHLDGKLVLPGFVDTHIHLDKACLLGRCGHHHGSVGEAIKAVAAMKRDFTVEDVYARGARVLERAIVRRHHADAHPCRDRSAHWPARFRGHQGAEARLRLGDRSLRLRVSAGGPDQRSRRRGAAGRGLARRRRGDRRLSLYGHRSSAHLEKLFDLAQAFDVDVDLHLDFDLDPSWWHLDEVCRQAERRNYQGRVAIGHATKLSALPPAEFDAAAAKLARAGVAVTVLPATDLYLMGRDATHNAPRGLTLAHKLVERGVVCSVATNNVQNPFTPFGDASLLRMANFYANVAHASVDEFDACLDLVTSCPRA